jgi:hypothetical protein
MGTYDDVHTGDRCGQTKALGKFLRHLVPGSRAQVFPAPLNEEEFEVWLAGDTEPVADTAQVSMPAGGFLTITEGVLRAWTDERDERLPLYGFQGRLETPPASDASKPEELGLRVVDGKASRPLVPGSTRPFVSSRPDDCPVCDGLRSRVLRVLRPASPLDPGIQE